MTRITLLVLLSMFMSGIVKASDFKGLWEAQDNAHRAIYGYIKVTEKKLYWGGDRNNLLCNSDYKVVLEETAKNYPGNRTSPARGVSSYTYYRLKILNKFCNYNEIENSYFHKKVRYIQLSLPLEYPNYAGFNDYDEFEKQMGWGWFTRLKMQPCEN